MPNDTILIDPELRRKQRKRRRLIKIGGGIALVLALGFLIGRPTRNAIKGWQARRHAEKAFDFIEKEKWNEATAEARAAYQLRPTEPAAIRALARLLSRTRQPDALGFWQQLRTKHPLTRQDLRDEIAIALFAGDLPTADGVNGELLGKLEGGPGPADYLLAAQVASQKGARDSALGYLAKITADPKASERQQLNASLLELAIVTADMPDAKERQATAWTRLTKIARGQSAVALDGLVILAQHSLSAPNEIVSDPAIMPDEELIRALETHPLSRTPQKLIALDLQMHIDPAKRDALVEEGINAWRLGDNDTLAALARWLNSKGEFQKELDTIPLERSLQTRELFLQRLDALGSLGQWAEVKRLLSDESFPLEPVIEHMYLARCSQQLGEITAGENNWQRALEAAENDGPKLLTLADYAEKNGAFQIAATAYDTITHDSPRVRPAQQGRLRLAQRGRDTRKIHAVLVEMLKQWPNDTAIQNDEAYTRLLLADAGKADTLKSIESLAEDLIKREPASLPHRTLLALARLKQDRPSAAFEVYADLRIPPNAASPSAVAVHAAVLFGCGREEDARTEAGAVNWDQLLPEEQALIAKLIN